VGGPTISGVLHVSLSVSDVERSKAFYNGTLGLPVLRDVFEGDVFEGREVILLPGLTGVCLQEHRANRGDEFDPTRTGLDHVAFAVDDLESLHAFAGVLDDAGIPHSGVKALTQFGHFIEFRDPDGIQVELQCLA
jgi:glyoxylase I family protein